MPVVPLKGSAPRICAPHGIRPTRALPHWVRAANKEGFPKIVLMHLDIKDLSMRLIRIQSLCAIETKILPTFAEARKRDGLGKAKCFKHSHRIKFVSSTEGH